MVEQDEIAAVSVCQYHQVFLFSDGFRKVAHVEHGGLKVEKDDMEFTHQYFMRGQEQLLELIKRKVRPSVPRFFLWDGLVRTCCSRSSISFVDGLSRTLNKKSSRWSHHRCLLEGRVAAVATT